MTEHGILEADFDAFRGTKTAWRIFMRKLAMASFPQFESYRGWGGRRPWSEEDLKNPLCFLLSVRNPERTIPHERLKPLAERLASLVRTFPEEDGSPWHERALRFAAGCQKGHSEGKPLALTLRKA